MSDSVSVNLHISAEEFLKLYKGSAKSVVTKSVDGRRIRFPARILQPYVTKNGVEGSFKIYFDEKGKFKWIDRL